MGGPLDRRSEAGVGERAEEVGTLGYGVGGPLGERDVAARSDDR